MFRYRRSRKKWQTMREVRGRLYHAGMRKLARHIVPWTPTFRTYALGDAR